MKLTPSLLVAAVVLAPAFAQAQTKAKPAAKPKTEQPAPAPARKPLAETLTGDAKIAYDAGVAAYRAGDYAGAAAKFNDAYKASNDGRLLWNVGAAEKQRQRYAKARTAIKQYQALVDDLTDKEKEDAKAMLTVLDTLVSEVTVNVDQPGAVITFDGEEVGRSPLSRPLEIDNGEHLVRVTKDDFLPFEQKVQVTQGMAPLSITLAPHVRDGRVAIRASVQNASILIDGQAVGTGTYSGILPSGSHKLDVNANGYKPYTLTFALAENGTRSFDVSLEKEKRRVPVWALIVGGAVIAGITTAVVITAASQGTEYKPLPAGTFPPGTVDLGSK